MMEDSDAHQLNRQSLIVVQEEVELDASPTMANEAEVIHAISVGMILAFGAAAALLLSGIEAPYGRYAATASK